MPTCSIGWVHEPMTVFLTTEDLLALAEELEVGPVQDLGLLDPAAHRPQTEVLAWSSTWPLQR